MSSETNEKTKRVIRRSIPHLIREKKWDSSSAKSGSGKDSANGSQTAPAVSLTTKHNKGKLEKKMSNYRERLPDDGTKTRPAISLQGPFNPDIVGARKNLDESKRKRHPTPTRQEEKTSPTLFTNVNPENPKTKRNPVQESKPKCTVDFSHKADTKFADDVDKSLVFTASGQGNNTMVTKRPPRDRRRRSSGNSGSSSRILEQKRTDNKQHSDAIQQLEEEKLSLIKKHAKEMSALKTEVNIMQSAIDSLKRENADLEKVFEGQELKNSGDDVKCLEIRNEALDKKLEVCQRKLEQLNVDPVSLTRFDDLDAEWVKENEEQAGEDAEKLKQILTSNIQRNQEIIAKFKSNNEETKENCPLSN